MSPDGGAATEGVKADARSVVAVAVKPAADNFRKLLLVCVFDTVFLGKISRCEYRPFPPHLLVIPTEGGNLLSLSPHRYRCCSFFLGLIAFQSSSVSTLPRLLNSPAPCRNSPPSMRMTSPLMYPDPSLTRKAARLANSSTVPKR